MTIGIAPRGGKPRWLAALGIVVVMGGLIGIGNVALAANSTAVSVVDYAQCADGTANDAATDCPGSWINGILQASNSTYHEDEVTPQRAELLVPRNAATSGHSFTFSYQTRKGSAGVHAYDSLATWNHTQTTADRNQGLNAADQVGGVADTELIPTDSTVVAPFIAPATGVTSTHSLTGQVFTMFGGTIDSVTTPVHDCAVAVPSFCGDATKDDFATITVNFHVAAAPQKVQLLFGGHIATSSGSRGWGANLGASNISGGPYHIKWTAADGSSVGNRDNQIMGSAILAVTTGLVTTPDPSTHVVSSSTFLQDSATLSGGNAPTGSILFKLFPPSDSTCAGTASYSESVPVNGNGTYTTTNSTVAATIVGTWHWTAHYSGDGLNQPSDSGCAAEPVTITKASPGVVTVATTPITIGGTISDKATISGLVLPDGTGTITFELYGPGDTTCTGTNLVAGDATFTVGPVNANGDYSSPTFTPTAVGTYRWIANFSGDANNNATSNTCNGTNEASVVNPITPTLATNPFFFPQDKVTFSGATTAGGDIKGSVTFKLYSDLTCTTLLGTFGPIAVDTSGGTALSYSTSQSTVKIASDGTNGAGTYGWTVRFDSSGNDKYASVGESSCSAEPLVVSFTSP